MRDDQTDRGEDRQPQHGHDGQPHRDPLLQIEIIDQHEQQGAERKPEVKPVQLPERVIAQDPRAADQHAQEDQRDERQDGIEGKKQCV